LKKTYSPKDNEGDQLPAESKKVQVKVDDVLQELRDPWIDLVNIILTNDYGNSLAKASIIVDDATLMSDVPVDTLIFLERQCDYFRNVLDKIPVLSLSHEWTKIGQ